MSLAQQDFDMFAGEDRDIEFLVTDEDGDPVDITGFSITWKLRGRGIALDKSVGSGLTITDGPNGVFEIAISGTDSAPLSGAFWHRAEVDDGVGDVTVVATGVGFFKDNAT